ncbi:hypothetical protein AVEN_106048-1, partial [Araneus ventricosus]
TRPIESTPDHNTASIDLYRRHYACRVYSFVKFSSNLPAPIILE